MERQLSSSSSSQRLLNDSHDDLTDDAQAPLLLNRTSRSRSSSQQSDDPELLELLSNTDSSYSSSSSAGSEDISSSDEDLLLRDRADEDDIYPNDDRQAPGLGATHWEEASATAIAAASSSSTTTPATTKRKPSPEEIERRNRRRRRVYGGNIDSDDELSDHEDADLEGNEGRGRTVGQVAWTVTATILAPINPVLVPHAFSLLGWKSGVISVLIVALLVWFTYMIIIVEARYVGARSFAELARAVFPLHGNKIASIIVGVWTIWLQGGKTIIGIVILTSLIKDLVSAWFSFVTWLANPTFLTLCVSISLLITTVFIPSRPKSTSLVRLTTFASYTAIIWPLALIIMGLRIPHIDWDSFSPDRQGKSRKGELLGYSPWGGIAILFFCFAPHSHVFPTYKSLSRSSRRHSWEAASFIGVFPAMAVILCWGLVCQQLLSSHLPSSISSRAPTIKPPPTSAPEENIPVIGINVFDDLPTDDGWIQLARVMIAFTSYINLPTVMAPARNSIYDAFRTIDQGLRKLYQAKFSNNNDNNDYQNGDNLERGLHVGGGTEDPASAQRNKRRSKRRRRLAKARRKIRNAALPKSWKWGIGKRVSGAVAWGGACLLAVWLRSNLKASASKNGRLASVVEILGCTGAVVLGFLLPALFFIVLFHIRKPRHIFVSDLARPEIQSDVLLLRKERQLQRRLSGRRVWQDLAVCVVLLPISIAVIIRGLLAIGRRTDW